MLTVHSAFSQFSLAGSGFPAFSTSPFSQISFFLKFNLKNQSTHEL
jgi:hypothetical protein